MNFPRKKLHKKSPDDRREEFLAPSPEPTTSALLDAVGATRTTPPHDPSESNQTSQNVKAAQEVIKETSSPKEELRPTEFKDKHGNVWCCDLDCGIVESIDNSDFSDLGIKDFSLLEPQADLFKTLLMKTRLLMACVWIAVRDQAHKNLHIDPNEDENKEQEAQYLFSKALNGPALDNARRAFVQALGDFHPDLATASSNFLRQWEENRKTVARKILASEPEVTQLLTEGMEQEFDAGILEMKRVLQERRAALPEEIRRVAQP